ncbi:MAG: Amuc_1100 family pilus-like protein [Kiritimatiellae bacterium]|nr:Amuc_1100 family pilus-like protein [Kiritimatiellia bacterium]
MNKNQLTMTVIGGAGAAVALVFFALLFLNSSTVDQRRQEVADLQNRCNALNGVSRDKTIEDDIAEIDGLMSQRYDSMVNTNLVRHTEKSENELKQAINKEFREIKLWPQNSSIKMIPADFLAKKGEDKFKVFYNYVKDEGAVAPKDKMLVARQWSDFYRIMELMRDAGVQRLEMFTDVVKAKSVVEVKKPSRNRSRKKTDEKPDESGRYSEQTYAVEFEAKPAALVKFMNMLANGKDKWFFAVESLFVDGEGFLQKIEGKKELAKTGAQAEQSIRPVVVDPATEAPLKVKMNITSVIFTQNIEKGKESK